MRLPHALLVVLASCAPSKVDTASGSATDRDGDGFEAPVDCDDDGPSTWPGAVEVWYDGVDQNCAMDDDFDADGDGWVPQVFAGQPTRGLPQSGRLGSGDCWDDALATPAEYTVVTGRNSLGASVAWLQPLASEVHPRAADTWYDGVDQDCAQDDDFDADRDGFPTDDWPSRTGFGTDCLDDPLSPGLDMENMAGDDALAVHPGADETWYDGTDQDCDGNDCDRDLDGHAFPGSPWCASEDCDDQDPGRYHDPSVTEVWYDGWDDDCDGGDGDQDGDGYWVWDYEDRVLAAGGLPMDIPLGASGDCWDDPADHDAHRPLNGFPALGADEVSPGVRHETWYDGIDQDCATDDDFDADRDGWTTDLWPGPDGLLGQDCDDGSSSTYPGAREVCDDADEDEDCDGLADDADPTATGQIRWYIDADGDGDGPLGGGGMDGCDPAGDWQVPTATDCDDDAPNRSGLALETDDDVDNDCDDVVDEGYRGLGDLVITELMVNPSGDKTDPQNTYIEIRNPSPTRDLFLDGMEVLVSTDPGYSFFIGPNGLMIPAEGTAVLCGLPTYELLLFACDYRFAANEHGVSAAGPTFVSNMWFSHSSALVRLSLGGTTLDEVLYNLGADGWPSARDGVSLELSTLRQTAEENDLGDSWCSGTEVIEGGGADLGTPGTANTCAD